MKRVGCEGYPARWETLYESVKADFKENGCPYLAPAYYDDLAARYGIFRENLALYKEAAALVRADGDLALLFHLLCRALENRATAYEETLALKLPKSLKGEHRLALDMLEALAIFSEIPDCYATLKRIGLPEDYIRETLSRLEYGVTEYRERNGGAPGYGLLYWNQRIIDGKLFRVGRLELELHEGCPAGAAVFENAKGERFALADGVKLHKSGYAHGGIFHEDETDAWVAPITETDTAYEGYPFDGKGFVLREKCTLKKCEWRPILTKKDNVISIHIPADGKLDATAVTSTYAEMKHFLKTYFPHFDYKAFYCASWLLDPTLEALLGEGSNIVKFGKGYRRFIALDGGYGVFYFAFKVTGKPGTDYPFDDLPEHTRLLQAIKNHYKSGKGIYAVSGVFFPDEVE